MKKKNILTMAIISLLSLCGCGNSNDSSSPANSSVDVLSSESIVSSETNNESSESIMDENNVEILTIKEVLLGAGEFYNLEIMLKDEYKNATKIVYESEDDSVCMVDDVFMDNIIGTGSGTTRIKMTIDDKYYQYVDVTVEEDSYVRKNFVCDKGRLQAKKAVIFGDSISDVTVSAYAPVWQDFWQNQMKELADMRDVASYAKSGSTVGYSIQRAYGGLIYGTHQVNQSACVDDLKDSDYAFILFGANDYCVKENLGEEGDVNDSNYQNTESFRGSYSYLINKIYAANPKVRIVCLSTTNSSWGLDNNYQQPEGTVYATTRPALNEVIKTIADNNNCKYIDIYGLWNEKIPTELETYCADGIHPTTAGYTKMVNKILNLDK